MITAVKTISLMCTLMNNHTPMTSCKEYMYECSFSHGRPSDEQLLNCIQKYMILNNSYKPTYTREPKCKEESNEQRHSK